MSFLTTYLGARERIDDAYVEPLIADRVISQEYLPPVAIEELAQYLIETPISQHPHRPAPSRFGPFSTSVTISKLNFLKFEAIAQQIPRLIILAEPGSGESTFLAYLCRRRLQFASPRLTVLLSKYAISCKNRR